MNDYYKIRTIDIQIQQCENKIKVLKKQKKMIQDLKEVNNGEKRKKLE